MGTVQEQSPHDEVDALKSAIRTWEDSITSQSDKLGDRKIWDYYIREYRLQPTATLFAEISADAIFKALDKLAFYQGYANVRAVWTMPWDSTTCWIRIFDYFERGVLESVTGYLDDQGIPWKKLSVGDFIADGIEDSKQQVDRS